jgi:hypothetical protein
MLLKEPTMVIKTIHNCMDSRKISDEKDEAAHKRKMAQGRLSTAKKWFAVRGWHVLPQGRRGQSILKWGAHHAWRAGARNPERSCRNWCRKYAPWLKADELDELVASTAERCTIWWSHDDCARVLGIGVADREAHELWFTGCDDDCDYETRVLIKQTKAAMRARRSRAAKSTGRPRGRPRLTPDEMAASKAKDAARKRDERVAECSGRPSGRPKSDGVPAWQAAGFSSERSHYRHKARGSENASENNASRSLDNIRQRDGIFPDGISVPPVSTVEPVCDRRPPEAARRQTLRRLIRLDEAPTGTFLDPHGVEIEIPPAYELPSRPKLNNVERGRQMLKEMMQ